MGFVKKALRNPVIAITVVALLLQCLMLVLFYSRPDPLGLSLSDMFSGRTIWQVVMAVGTVTVISSIFALLKAPRGLAIFYMVYFFFAIADYEVYRFNHQRLSLSFIRTYFHPSNIFDATTVSTLGGDGIGTVFWVGLLFVIILAAIVFCVVYTVRKWKQRTSLEMPALVISRKASAIALALGIFLSAFPWILFLAGVRGTTTFPFAIDWRFTLGKYTLTAPVLHIAGLEMVEFVKDSFSITDELVDDLDAFLPKNFREARLDRNYPGYRGAETAPFKAEHPYNILFIFGESFKGRIINQMLDGDTTLAPNLWNLANRGGLWFKNAYSGSYPTVRGTMSAYLGFPSHPNRDVPCFYASNHFKGFPEYLVDYERGYMTVSNPIFDQTLPFVTKFFGDNWVLPEEPKVVGIADSLGTDAALKLLATMPTDKNWLMVSNTIATHIPFRNYPDDFAPKPDDAMERYRNALRYTDSQLERLFRALSERPDFERTVVFILGDHDTPVDSIDYVIPQPLGVASARIFMGIFSADTNLFQGLTVREDVASQLDLGPTILDLAQVRAPNHFWGYDLLTQERPAEQPAVFFSQNAYYLGFRDHVIMGGLDNEDVYRGENETYKVVNDSLSRAWKKHAVGAAKVVRSLLRNDNMEPVQK